MKLRRKGESILMQDILSPDMPVAKFCGNLVKPSADMLVLEHNAGTEVLALYEQYRDNLHVTQVVEMLTKMESVFHEYDKARYAIKRSGCTTNWMRDEEVKDGKDSD